MPAKTVLEGRYETFRLFRKSNLSIELSRLGYVALRGSPFLTSKKAVHESCL